MKDCRNCGSGDMSPVLSLGEQPLANAYLDLEAIGRPEPRFPLTLMHCPGCGLVQLSHIVPPAQLFTAYPYFSSVSDAFVTHAGDLAASVVAARGLTAASLVVEIGSNDGYLLRHYCARGVRVLGIDPAANVAQIATKHGVPTITDFFGLALADRLRDLGQRADVIHANNVLAHVPNLHGVVEGIARLLKEDGIVIIETPYVRDMVERVEFDTIYHEHVFYYSLGSLAHVLAAHDLTVIDVKRITVHGGSLRVTAALESSGWVPRPAVAALRAQEASLSMASEGYYRGFASQVDDVGQHLRRLLDDLKSRGGSIAAYGAAAKGTVLLNACKLGTETLDFVADRSPYKHGLFMPGVHLPIVPAEELARQAPAACLLLAWNFADEIIQQQQAYRAGGGRFILPSPQPRYAD